MRENTEASALSERERAVARDWYGYGRWTAPYWFVGIEPGGDELDACVRMWETLGRGELVDIEEHHDEHARDWFGPTVTEPQKTWQKLIWLLMYFKGEDPTFSSIRKRDSVGAKMKRRSWNFPRYLHYTVELRGPDFFSERTE